MTVDWTVLWARLRKSSSHGALWRFGATTVAALSFGLVSTQMVAGDKPEPKPQVEAHETVSTSCTCGVGAATSLQGSSSRRLPLPWPAPIGHRQPKATDVPDEPLSEFEVEQKRMDSELDRKLLICRGC
jgi:hypothetical protein